MKGRGKTMKQLSEMWNEIKLGLDLTDEGMPQKTMIQREQAEYDADERDDDSFRRSMAAKRGGGV
jgi:hypothetical protein